jgi:hypothetical protein
MAIAGMARRKGDAALADRFTAEADRIKAQVEKLLWDPSRQFFFPMSNQEHEKDGHVVKKHTLTYQTGAFAGSPHGRELHGYVPWAFNMPGPGFEDAWRFLMDEDFFMAPFGPTTLERNDPQFVLQNSCCWWSGHSWPFATTQTLKAMANLLQNYRQSHVDRGDYARLFHTFAITHRKDGRPYIAEAAHPFTGSWDGHDMMYKSSDTFHKTNLTPLEIQSDHRVGRGGMNHGSGNDEWGMTNDAARRGVCRACGAVHGRWSLVDHEECVPHRIMSGSLAAMVERLASAVLRHPARLRTKDHGPRTRLKAWGGLGGGRRFCR